MQRGGSNVTIYNRSHITAAEGQCSQIECDMTTRNIRYTGLQLAYIGMISYGITDI